MKGKMKKILLAVGLCLMIGLQSAGAVQAAVNYEACPSCGIRVTREHGERMIHLDFESECGLHGDCAIYLATFEKYTKLTCEIPGCIHYDRYIVQSTYKGEIHGTVQ